MQHDHDQSPPRRSGGRHWRSGGRETRRNATLEFSGPPAGAISLLVQGSPTGVTSPDSYTTIRTLVAADMKSGRVELFDLPAFLRLNVGVAGTAATVSPVLRGTQ